MRYCEYCKNKMSLKDIYYKSDTVFLRLAIVKIVQSIILNR